MHKQYMVITPARDEERFLPFLIESMVRQTIKPRRWIIIDDGSADATAALADAAARQYCWIQVRHLERNRVRKRGGASIVMQHLPPEAWADVDFILRLDADISFGPPFVQSLMAEFARDPALGIAGATLQERRGRTLGCDRVPAFHTRGATKMYKRACFEAIGGLEAGPGWDTIDETRAMMRGFKTRSFTHINAIHHRPLGAADGRWRVLVAGGRAAYHAGYSPVFIGARAARRALSAPVGLSGILLLSGYLGACLRREPRTAEADLVRFVRQQQLRRLMLKESLWR
jgi:biofilm PGA synthesis N-glycosyltransferase PgaC